MFNIFNFLEEMCLKEEDSDDQESESSFDKW